MDLFFQESSNFAHIHMPHFDVLTHRPHSHPFAFDHSLMDNRQKVAQLFFVRLIRWYGVLFSLVILTPIGSNHIRFTMPPFIGTQ
jgi:hypothetical protein